MKKLLSMSLVLALLTGCGSNENTPVANDLDQYMYEITDQNGNKDYMLGAYHRRNGKIYTVSSMIENAFLESDELIIEASPMEIEIQMVNDESYATTNKVNDVADSKTLEAFSKIPEYKNYDTNLYNAMTIYTLIAINNNCEVPFVALASTGINGIERYLAETAVKTKKPIIELEGANRQIEMMKELSKIAPNYLLEKTLDKELLQDNGKKMYEAYLAANYDELYQLLTDYKSNNYPDEAAQIKDYLVDQRNTNFYQQISKYVEDDKTQFMVISIAQLYGDHGLIKLLESDGYSIKLLTQK